MIGRQITKVNWEEGATEMGEQPEKWVTLEAKRRECLWRGEWLEQTLLVPTHGSSACINKETTKRNRH